MTTIHRGISRYRVLAALAGLGLTAAAVVVPAAVASAGPKAPAAAPVVQQAPVGVTALAVPGNWTLAYDWGCDGSYGTITVTLNANGTWSGGGFTGLWVSLAGQLALTFDNSETTYSGNIASMSVTGINTTFTGLNGCFYLLHAGAPTALSAVRTESLSAAGTK